MIRNRFHWYAPLLLIAAGPIVAQTIVRDLLDGTTPPGIAPGAAVGSFSVSNLESVNLFSGGLGFTVPLLSVGGRGDVGYTMSATVETRWIIMRLATGGNVILYPNAGGAGSSGYAPGYLQLRFETDELVCGLNTYAAQTLTRFHWISQDGNDQELIDRSSGGTPGNTGLTCVNDSVQGTPTYRVRGLEFFSTDGSGLTFVSDADVTDGPTNPAATGYLMRKDGMRFRVQSGLVQWMSDRNGNRITFETLGDVYDRPRRITDPLGRIITIEYAYPAPLPDPHPNEDWIRFTGGTTGTTERIIKVRYALLGILFRDAGTQVRRVRQLFPGCDYGLNGPNDYDYNPAMVREIVLPDGQQKYSFRYNEYGELSKAELPTGGRFEYDWIPRTQQPGGQYGELMVYRRLSVRRVYSSGGVEEGGTTYDAPVLGAGGPNLAVTATEKDPGGAIWRITESTFWGTPLAAAIVPVVGYSRWKDGRTFQEDVKKPDGTLIQRIFHTWRQRHPTTHLSFDPADAVGPLDPRIVETQRTLGSVVSRTTTSYTVDPYNNPAERCEYDFGLSQIIRCTKSDYETSPDYTGTGVHLRALVKTEGVYLGGNTVKEAETKYIYDTSALTDRVGIIEREPARGISYVTRGNPTTIERWCNTCGADPWVRSYLTYDIAGNVVQITHPKVQTPSGVVAPVTQVTYNDSYGSAPPGPTFAFPTSITHPGGLTTSATFHYQLGRIRNFTDPNSKTTFYEYGEADALDRLTTVTHPIGQTKFSYQYLPAQNETKITSQKSLVGGQWIVNDSYLDGLGRQKRAVSAASGTVETAYDALGRVKRVYGSGTTPMAYSYDVLDRQENLTYEADNSRVCTAYTGAETVSRDPAGIWRKSVQDGLGRLTTVVEDPAASIADCGGNTGTDPTTGYGYDARGNLVSVNQSGRLRSFTYDSLARLLSATAPEWGNPGQAGGTTSYQYDEAGNLTGRTDPRNTITTLRYNVRSQIRTKTYTAGAGTAATPDTTFCYDGDVTGACAGGPAGANLLGRLTQVVSSAGTMKYAEFDNLGRVTRSQHKLNGQDYQFLYGYNDVALTSLTWPSGRTASYGYDGAGRVSGLTGTPPGQSTKTYVSGIVYAAHGAEAQRTLGNGVVETLGYNSRLQQTGLTVTQGATNALTLGYGFGTTNNNGNVLSQTTGGVANGAAFNFPASYSYDGLNRLKTMYEANTCARTYAYDRYGNRAVVQSAYWCMTQEPWTPQVSSDSAALVEAQFPKNRWTGGTNLSYDPAGNQLSVAGPKSFTYDAENRLATMTQGGTVSYAYDGEGRRVSKTVGTATTRYVYDAFGQLAAEYASPAPTSVPCTTCYLTADHLGSTRLVTDQAGAVVERRDYFPFGEEMPVAGSVRASIAGYSGDAGQALKFTGKERDQESGLDYFGARYMSSTQGRFTSADPTLVTKQRVNDPQQWNLYSYVRNNPLMFIDPDGRDIRIAVTSVSTGESYVNRYTQREIRNSRGRVNQVSETAPKYRIIVSNDSGSGFLAEATRDTNRRGSVSETRGNYGRDHEAPPGAYSGGIRNDGDRGFRIELGDTDSIPGVISGPDGERRNIQIHIGPGCSEGCMLLPGGRAGRDSFQRNFERLRNEDRENGYGAAMRVVVIDRNPEPIPSPLPDRLEDRQKQ